MSCLGQCGDCNCNGLDVCEEHAPRNKKLGKKLRVIKDYACLLATTTCVNLPKRVGEFAYFLWCFLRDLLIMIRNLEKRVDNLCEVVKCHEKKIDSIAKMLQGDLSDSVDFQMTSTGTTVNAPNGQDTYTKITTDKNGNFKIEWNMIDQGEAGKGVINGIVNHTYTQNDDGTITAEIKSFTLKNAVYSKSSGSTTNHVASFTVSDKNGRQVWKRSYDPAQPWSETINQTVPVGVTLNLKPKGGTSGNIPILTTYDDWTHADTQGSVSAIYTNNHSGVVVNLEPCGIKCTACEHKEDIDAI